MSVATAVIGGVFWIVAAFLWLARRDERRALKQLQGLGLSTAEGLTAGAYAAMHGEVRSAQPDTDPVTGEAVAFWEARLERLDSAGRRVRVLLTQRGTKLSVDGVSVLLEGAQIDVEEAAPVQAEGVPNDAMRALLDGTEDELPPPDETRPTPGMRWELSVRRVALGEPMTVIGTPVERDGELVFAGMPRLTPKALGTLVEEEEQASKAMDRMVLLAAVVGLGALVAAVLLAVT